MSTNTKTTQPKPAPRKKGAPKKKSPGTQEAGNPPLLVALQGAIWHAREFRAQGPPGRAPDQRNALCQRFALWHEPAMAKLLTTCLPHLPTEIPPLKWEPDGKTWYLLRLPALRKEIFLLRATGYPPEKIAPLIKKHYPGFGLEQTDVERLLYLFFQLPDPQTGAHLEILACAQALAPLGPEFPEFDRYVRALSGTLRQGEYYRHIHQPLNIHQQLQIVALAKTELLLTLQAASRQAHAAKLRHLTAVLKSLGDLEQQFQDQEADGDLLHDYFMPLLSREDQEREP